ncbi:MAG: SMI1/KNR4 family protein [Casimicrobium sp.]
MKLEFKKLGLSNQEMAQLARFGIKLDKRFKRAYEEEFSSPSTASEQDVRSLETSISPDCKLPDDYKKFLLEFNGGKPEPDVIKVPGRRGGEAVIDRFFPLRFRLENETVAFKKAQTYRGRIPGEVLPVACDAAGNLFLLCVSGENVNQVFFWDHEREADGEKQPYFDNMTFIADSFDSFLNSIVASDTDEAN